MAFIKPTKEQIEQAGDKRVPDLIAPGLDLLFCGINPGLYSAATGHHFAWPGNRFWPALHASGFTQDRLHPSEEHQLLKEGMGITNIGTRATRSADELTTAELLEGGVQLREKVLKYYPSVMAILGITAYRVAFRQPKAVMGLQEQKIGNTFVYVLPSPSGLNAHYTPAQLAVEFRKLLLFVYNKDM